MPGTLREFSQWLDWVAEGKPKGGPRTGDAHPAGRLYDALLAEADAKQHLAVIAVDKDRALAWMAAYNDRGITGDESVTTEFRFGLQGGYTKAGGQKINSDRLKSRYPAVWARCRTYVPYRSVKLPAYLQPELPSRFMAVEPLPVELAAERQRLAGELGKGVRDAPGPARGSQAVREGDRRPRVATSAQLVLETIEVRQALAKFWDGNGLRSSRTVRR